MGLVLVKVLARRAVAVEEDTAESMLIGSILTVLLLLDYE